MAAPAERTAIAPRNVGTTNQIYSNSIRSQSPRPTMISSRRHQAARLGELRTSKTALRVHLESAFASETHILSDSPDVLRCGMPSASDHSHFVTDRQHSDSDFTNSDSDLSNAVVIKSYCPSQSPAVSLSSNSVRPGARNPDATISASVRLRGAPRDSTTTFSCRRQATLPRLSSRFTRGSSLVERGRESALASWATENSSLDVRSRPLSSRIGLRVHTPLLSRLGRAVADVDPACTARAVQKSRESADAALPAPGQNA